MKTDYTTYHFTKKEYAKLLGVSFLLTAGVDFVLYRALWAFVLWIPLTVLCVRYRRRVLIRRRREALYHHFRDLISSMHFALRAGYSLENSVREAACELEKTYGKEDLLVKEVRMMLHQMELSIPVEQLFTELAGRSGLEDLETFASVLAIAKRTGGDMEEVFQNTWEILCTKIDTARDIRSGLQARRYEQMVMNVVPFAMIVYIQITFPDFMDAMYGNGMGIGIMTGCLVTYGAAWLLGERLLAVEIT